MEVVLRVQSTGWSEGSREGGLLIDSFRMVQGC